MTFLEDAKKPYNLVMALLTVFAIALSVYFYLDGKKEKSICYAIESTPSLIFDSKKVSPNIKVIEKDSNIISENIYILKGFVWNNGDMHIENRDIKRDLLIKLNDSSRIIDYKIDIQTDKENKNFQLNKIDNTSLKIFWEYFEPKDGFKFQIICISNHEPSFSIQGKILEIKQIEQKDYHQRNDDAPPKKIKILIILFSMITSLYVVFASGFYDHMILFFVNLSTDKDEASRSVAKASNIIKKANKIAGIIIIIGMIILSLFALFNPSSPPPELL